jgi:hypothetical protein
MTIAIAPARYVTIALAAATVGYTVEAIEAKIARGVWVEGREWRRAPDGRVLIDTKGVERWVEGLKQEVSAKIAARSN